MREMVYERGVSRAYVMLSPFLCSVFSIVACDSSKQPGAVADGAMGAIDALAAPVRDSTAKTDDAAEISDPWIYFTRYCTTTKATGTYRVHASGSDLSRVTPQLDAKISKDGQRLLHTKFVTTEDNLSRQRIFIEDVASGAVEELPLGPYTVNMHVTYPSWNAEQTGIFYVREDGTAPVPKALMSWQTGGDTSTVLTGDFSDSYLWPKVSFASDYLAYHELFSLELLNLADRKVSSISQKVLSPGYDWSSSGHLLFSEFVDSVDGFSPTVANQIVRFDPKTEARSTFAIGSPELNVHGLAVLDDNTLVVGGITRNQDGKFSNPSRMFVLDLQSGHAAPLFADEVPTDCADGGSYLAVIP